MSILTQFMDYVNSNIFAGILFALVIFLLHVCCLLWIDNKGLKYEIKEYEQRNIWFDTKPTQKQ